MDVKVIKTPTEYEAALKRLSELMVRQPPLGSDEGNLLELLFVVISDYEQRVIAPPEVDPVEAIKFRMDQMQLMRKDLVPFIGSASKVSEVLSGTRSLSLSMIRKLHEGLGIPLESLLMQPRPRKPARKRLVKRPRRRPPSIRKRRKTFS